MRLNDIDFGAPFETTIYGERFLNDAKGLFENYSEVDPWYDPQGSIPHIDLPFTWLPEERIRVFQSEPSQEIMRWVSSGNVYRFLWHPDVLREEFDIAGTVQTQPTSSTRTLLTQSSPRLYIKTDLNKKHFRFIRKLQKSSVEHSIIVCNDLRQACVNLREDSRYTFLPESLGLVVCGGKHEGSGVIFRETVPYPHVHTARVIVPYHSLYANDPHQPLDKPLLVQIVELHDTNDKLRYFVSEVVGPILEAWVFLVSTRGILPELHGQNALAEIDSDFRIRRMVHRDFQSTYSDSRMRTTLGILPFTKHIAGSEAGTTIQSQYSNVFDGMIGRYLLSRLSRVFCQYFGVKYSNVCGTIKDYHQSLHGWQTAQFPKTTYRFGTRAQDQIGNEVTLIDTGEPPEFR